MNSHFFRQTLRCSPLRIYKQGWCVQHLSPGDRSLGIQFLRIRTISLPYPLSPVVSWDSFLEQPSIISFLLFFSDFATHEDMKRKLMLLLELELVHRHWGRGLNDRSRSDLRIAIWRIGPICIECKSNGFYIGRWQLSALASCQSSS